MGVLYSKIPKSVKDEIIDPYISINNNEGQNKPEVKDSLKI